jgi:hypothetical protein
VKNILKSNHNHTLKQTLKCSSTFQYLSLLLYKKNLNDSEKTLQIKKYFIISYNSSFIFNFLIFYEQINVFLDFFHKDNYVFLIFKYNQITI